MEWFVETPDGRTLAVEDAGDRDGRPVLLPDLVPAAASLASPAPYDAGGLDWMAGFSPAAVEEVRLMLADPAGARMYFQQEREKLLGVSPAQAAVDLQAYAPRPAWRCSPRRRSPSSRRWRPASRDPGTTAWRR